MKKKFYIKAILIVLQIISIWLIFWYGIRFYSNYNLLQIADKLEPNVLIVDSFITTSANSSNSQDGFAIGYINNEKKYYLLNRNVRERKNIIVGDTLLVWSAENKTGVKLRSPGEREFNKKKYIKQNKNFIIYVFFPIIIFWILKIYIIRKINK